MESCPRWPKEHDWKSCKPLKWFRGFESLALRQEIYQKPSIYRTFSRCGYGAIFTFVAKILYAKIGFPKSFKDFPKECFLTFKIFVTTIYNIT